MESGLANRLVAEPDRTVVWLGAGASANTPTCLPLGERLTWDALERFCTAEAVERIKVLHKEFGLVREGSALPPRLEVVLGAAIGEVPDAVFELLEPLIGAPPNLVHHLAAHVAASGGAVVTTNFDECVERAAGAVGPSPVVHIHGVLSRREDLPELGAFFGTIERGLLPVVEQRLDAVLAGTGRLVFIGYSASDYFDVRPYLATLRERGVDLSGCEVVWLAHGGHQPPEIDRYKEWFESAGASFKVVAADTMAAVEATWDSLGLRRPVLGSPAVAPPAAPPIDDQARVWTSYRLLEALGDVQGRADLIAGGLDPSPNERAAVAWSQGRYTTSMRWNRRAEVRTLADRMYRQERTGACLWAQGRLVPALVVLWRSRRLAVQCLASGGAAEVAAAAGWIDTTVRTLEHMDRVELRILPKAAMRRTIRSMIPEDVTSLGFHVGVRLNEVKLFLDSGAGSEPARTVTEQVRNAMEQASSLAGNVNYRHRRLRDLAANGHPAPPSEYRAVQELAYVLGATGDGVRIMFVPGAATEFTLDEVVRALFPRWFGQSEGPQFGFWQRVRVLGKFSTWRLRERTGI